MTRNSGGPALRWSHPTDGQLGLLVTLRNSMHNAGEWFSADGRMIEVGT
jgi:hypothetical protein